MWQVQVMDERGRFVSGQVFDTKDEAAVAAGRAGGVWRIVWGPKKLEAARRLLGIK